jgi:WD40 repeat protein
MQEERDIYCVAFSPDSKRVYSGGGPVFSEIHGDYSTDSLVTVWHATTGGRIFTIGGKDACILRFCLAPNGRSIYSCGDKVLVWNTDKSAPPIQKLDASGRRMISIAVSPDGTMLAAGGADGTVVIWNADSGTRLAKLAHSGGPVYGLAFSPTSRKLVAAGEGGIATVWEIEIAPSRRE